VSIDVKDRVWASSKIWLTWAHGAFCGAISGRRAAGEKVVLVAPYLKSTNVIDEMEVIFYGTSRRILDHHAARARRNVDQTRAHWRDNGATLDECEKTCV